jgi:hypothetical protein
VGWLQEQLIFCLQKKDYENAQNYLNNQKYLLIWTIKQNKKKYKNQFIIYLLNS